MVQAYSHFGRASWRLTAVAVAFFVQIFRLVDRRRHLASDALYGIVPFWAPTSLSLAWIADRTGGRVA